jgi:hypothetical protein
MLQRRKDAHFLLNWLKEFQKNQTGISGYTKFTVFRGESE